MALPRAGSSPDPMIVLLLKGKNTVYKARRNLRVHRHGEGAPAITVPAGSDARSLPSGTASPRLGGALGPPLPPGTAAGRGPS